jgi:hypothetical protein
MPMSRTYLLSRNPPEALAVSSLLGKLLLLLLLLTLLLTLLLLVLLLLPLLLLSCGELCVAARWLLWLWRE